MAGKSNDSAYYKSAIGPAAWDADEREFSNLFDADEALTLKDEETKAKIAEQTAAMKVHLKELEDLKLVLKKLDEKCVESEQEMAEYTGLFRSLTKIRKLPAPANALKIITKLEKDKLDLEQKLVLKEAQIEAERNDKTVAVVKQSNLNDTISNLNEQLSVKNAINADLLDKLNTANQEITKSREIVARLEAEAVRVNRRATEAEEGLRNSLLATIPAAEKSRLEEQIRRLSRDLGEARDEVVGSNAVANELRNQKTTIENNLSTLRIEHKYKTDALTAKADAHTRLIADYAKSQLACTTLTEEKVSLTSQLQASLDSESSKQTRIVQLTGQMEQLKTDSAKTLDQETQTAANQLNKVKQNHGKAYMALKSAHEEVLKSKDTELSQHRVFATKVSKVMASSGLFKSKTPPTELSLQSNLLKSFEADLAKLVDTMKVAWKVNEINCVDTWCNYIKDSLSRDDVICKVRAFLPADFTIEGSETIECLEKVSELCINLAVQLESVTSELNSTKDDLDTKSANLESANTRLKEQLNVSNLERSKLISEIQTRFFDGDQTSLSIDTLVTGLTDADTELKRLRVEVVKPRTVEHISQIDLPSELVNFPRPLDNREITDGHVWYPTGYEFLIGGSIKEGEKIVEVDTELLLVMNAQVEVFKEITRERVKGKKRAPQPWPRARDGHRCVRSRADMNDDSDIATAPEHACIGCIEQRVPCVMAYRGKTPVVLPLPEEDRKGGPTELGYYVKAGEN